MDDAKFAGCLLRNEADRGYLLDPGKVGRKWSRSPRTPFAQEILIDDPRGQSAGREIFRSDTGRQRDIAQRETVPKTSD